MTENYYSLVTERRQQESDQIQHCEALIEQIHHKNEQAQVGRARMLATRKNAMLGRTGNQTLAEQRRKVYQRN